jgi:hypothetical protein
LKSVCCQKGFGFYLNTAVAKAPLRRREHSGI